MDTIFVRNGRGPRNNRLDFGGDADHDSDPMFLDSDQDPWRWYALCSVLYS